MCVGALRPAATLDALHPPNTAYAPRSSRNRTRWVMDADYKLDALTGVALTIAGAMPVICHHGSATAPALELFDRAGLTLPLRVLLYEREEESVTLAASLAAEGSRLAYIHPPPESLDRTAALLVPPENYAALNDKANLGDLVDERWLAPRRLVDPESAYRMPFPGRSVFLKAGHDEASGGGAGVIYCSSAADWRAALDWFSTRGLPIHRLVIEDAVDVSTSWCLNVAVLPETTRYLGSALQLLGAPGRQIGSRIDAAEQPPEEAVEVALSIGEQSRRRGYLGIAGFDIGIDRSGRLFVFDLNFRLNSSTAFVLLHEAATSRLGAAVTQSVNVTFDAPLAPAIERIAPLVDQGRFVPTRLYDGRAGGSSVVTGIVVGGSAAETSALERSIANALTAAPGR